LVRHQVAKSLLWTALESGGLSSISLLTLIAFAWLLSPEQIGLATIALSVVQLLTVPVDVLFRDALVQRPCVEEAHFETALTASLALGLALVLLGWACSGVLARFVGVAEIAPIFAVMNLSLIPAGLAAVIAARQRRNLDFRSLAVRSLVGRSAGAGIGVAVAVYGAGVWSLVAQQILMVTCAAMVLCMSARRPRLRFSFRHFYDLIGFGLRSVTVVSADFACQPIFTLLVGVCLGPVSAGYINIAFRVVDMVRGTFASGVVQLALPVFQQYQESLDRLRRGYSEASSFTCLLSFPVFAGLAVCSSEVVELVFGAKWIPSAPYVFLLSTLALPYFARVYAMPIMAAVGKPQAALPGLLAALAVVIVGTMTVGRGSLAAAAGVWAARLIASTPIDALILRRVSGIGLRTQIYGGLCPLIASIIMFGAVQAEKLFVLPGLPIVVQLAAMVSVGAVVYGCVILMLDYRTVTRLADFMLSAIGRRIGVSSRLNPPGVRL